MLEITWAGETLDLLPQKALHWRRRRMLLVADLHLGKAAHFRASGIPVPAGTTQATLGRLSQAIEATGCEEVVFLGDLFHAKGGVTGELLEALASWRSRHADVAMNLVAGNHDLQAGPPPDSVGIDHAGDQWRVDGLVLRHHPEAVAGGAVIAGHLHPGLSLRGAGGQAMRVPCYHFGRSVAVLPAFGDFTGLATIRPKRGDRVFAVGPDKIIEIPVATDAMTPTA